VTDKPLSERLRDTLPGEWAKCTQIPISPWALRAFADEVAALERENAELREQLCTCGSAHYCQSKVDEILSKLADARAAIDSAREAANGDS
jgi:hypothetical protein